MNRPALALLSLLLMLQPVWVAAAWAAPFADAPALDQETFASVAEAGLAFMAPRILEPFAVSQLALWGMRGLTSLDPRLTPELRAGLLELTLATDDGERMLWSQPVPPETDATAWGHAAASMMRAGWNASRLVRRTGQQHLVQTFFDELCSHLDPYSRYVPPDQAAAEGAAREGGANIGATLALQGQNVVVQAVETDGPAQTAGVRPADVLVAVDGEDVDAADLDMARKALEGQDGSGVLLTIRHRDGSEHELQISRALEGAQGVTAQRSGEILLVRVPFFSSGTGRSLAREIAAGLAARVHGVVLDLRGNRGGLLRQAVAAVDALLASGLVAETTGRDPAADMVYRAAGPDAARGLPAVVLVDGDTASAAEIFAAALADQRRAVVVGSATLGKGLVQAVAPLPDGGALYVTWSRVLAPLGWPIQGLGVLPQVCTSFGREAAMRQLGELEAGRQPMAGALDRNRAARPPVSNDEVLAIRAACPAAEGRELDVRVARMLVQRRIAYQAALLGGANDAAAR